MSDSLPTTGYADYKRTDEQAVDVLVDVTADSTPNPTYGRFFVGQTPSLEISFNSGIQNHDLDIAFFPEQVGGSAFALTRYTAIANSDLRMRVPVYAPWVLLQVLPKSGTLNGTHSLTVLTSRRIAGAPIPLFNTDLLHIINRSVAAATTDVEKIDVPYTGWVHWHAESNAANWDAEYQALDREDTALSKLIRFDALNADSNINAIFHLPPLIIEQRLRNNDAAARTFHVSLIPVFL